MENKLLSSSTHEKIRAHLALHWKQSRDCPMCGSKNWHVQPGGIQQIVEESVIGDYEGSIMSISSVHVVCKVCFFYYNLNLYAYR